MAQRASSYSSLTSVDVAGTPVQLVNNIKLLCVTLDTNLTMWEPMWEHTKHVYQSCFYHIRAFRHIRAVSDKSTAADIAAALVSSWLDYANSAHRRGDWNVCSAFKIQLQELYYSSHHYPHGTHFSNFTGFLTNGGYSLSWLPLPTKSYALVLRHICLNASIPTFLLAPCDHHPPLTCTSLTLIFISVHARFILQLQQSEFSPFYSSFVSNLKHFPKTS